MNRRQLLAFTATAILLVNPASAAAQSFVLATTTSTENSGLLDALIPQFTAKTGIKIDVVAIGTGQALAMGRRGDAAALLTHDRMGEDEFVKNGYGKDRRDVMYNDFIFIGPDSDPAGLKNVKSTTAALQSIMKTGSVFVSRGDDSGTHRKERRLWGQAGLDPTTFGDWYREAGSGMGQTIITATQMGAYTLSDRSTWTKFASKANHIITFESDPPLHNPYSSIIVTNDLIPETETEAATKWHEWLTGIEGQKAIAGFRVDGQQLFFIDADKDR